MALLLNQCPSSLCLPRPTNGRLTRYTALPRSRTISSQQVTPHPSHSVGLPSLRYLHTHPRPTTPLLHIPTPSPPPTPKLSHLPSTQTGPPALSGPTQLGPVTLPSYTIPIFRLRATSAKAQAPRTPGSTSPPRTQPTTRWVPDQVLVLAIPGLTRLDRTMEPRPAQPRFPAPRTLALSPCSSKATMWRMRRPWLERDGQ